MRLDVVFITLPCCAGRIGRIVLRNALLDKRIEVVAVNEYVCSAFPRLLSRVLRSVFSPFIALDYMVRSYLFHFIVP